MERDKEGKTGEETPDRPGTKQSKDTKSSEGMRTIWSRNNGWGGQKGSGSQTSES